MRSADRAGTPAVEDIPESLGVALGVRQALGLAGPLAEPGPEPTRPPAPASEDSGWTAWWSYLIGERVARPGTPVDPADLAALAGPHLSEARDWFARRKMVAARRLSGHPLAATPGWHRWTDGPAPLRIDVLPVDDPYVVRVRPFCWLMSLGSRLDQEAVARACRRDIEG